MRLVCIFVKGQILIPSLKLSISYSVKSSILFNDSTSTVRFCSALIKVSEISCKCWLRLREFEALCGGHFVWGSSTWVLLFISEKRWAWTKPLHWNIPGFCKLLWSRAELRLYCQLLANPKPVSTTQVKPSNFAWFQGSLWFAHKSLNCLKLLTSLRFHPSHCRKFWEPWQIFHPLSGM